MAKKNSEKIFWSYVCKSLGGECWPWLGHRGKTGYGRFSWDGKQRQAHRLSLIFSGVPVPDDKFACHTCDNKWCVNPSHLYVGTSADNVRDAIDRGLAYMPPRNDNRGSRHGMSKITEDVALAIKNAVGSQKKIGADFGVSQATVSAIKLGIRWRHI